MPKRQRNLYKPGTGTPFKLSRSRLENFLNCPRCFYLDRRLGVEPPPGFPFNLNSAVDELLKKEFDRYRAEQKQHPLMKKYGVDAVPFSHADLPVWRENFKGIQYHVPETNFVITGAIDDIWIDSKKDLIIVDYKSTSKAGEITLDEEWKDGYKRQMEIYQWLFRKNGFKVSRTGYFVCCNGLRDAENFNDCLKFKTVLLPYQGDDSWLDDVILSAYRCLESDDIPGPASDCEYCSYRQNCSEIENR